MDGKERGREQRRGGMGGRGGGVVQKMKQRIIINGLNSPVMPQK